MKSKIIITSIIRPLWLAVRHTSLLRGFVGREIRGRFAGNMAGMSWALLNPLATLLVYMFVFSMILRISVTVEETGTDSFFIYFVTGFIPWLIFSDSLGRATGSLLDNSSLITKVVFPVELLPATSVLSSAVINGLGFFLLLGYLSVQGFLSSSWLFVICILPVQVIFTLGLAMLFSSACVYLRDIRELMGLIIMIWFFSTPIIYPLSMVPENIQSIIQLNPMYMFVSLYRDALLMHSFDLVLFLWTVLISVVVYAAGSLFFAKVKPGFGDVL